MEWSAGDMADLLAGRLDPTDEDLWAVSNPGMGIRITPEHIAREQRSLLSRTFATERLGIGDWPSEEEMTHVIVPDTWAALTDRMSRLAGPVSFGVDMDPARSVTVIGVAGKRNDGRLHVEVAARLPGTSGAVDRIKTMVAAHDPVAVVIDERSPAASLLPGLKAAGVAVETTNARAMGQACGTFYDLATQNDLRHLGQVELDQALLSAKTRPIGDGAWGWDRKDGGATIAPLVAVTLAAHGLAIFDDPSSAYEDRGLLSL
jgi:hypothetical protein